MAISIKKLPESERPYEKFQMYGAESLSNAELLAIIIKSGTKNENAISLAQKILSLNPTKDDSLRFLQDLSSIDFTSIKGIGKIKATQLQAICELSKRISRPINKINKTIKSSKDVADLFLDELKYEKREKLILLLLNTKNKIEKVSVVSTGTSDRIIVQPKDILSQAIKIGSPKIILIHNHPSGDPTPSMEDHDFTLRVKDASKILGIQLLDHIIIGDNSYKSII